jgi:hypothetical protein
VRAFLMDDDVVQPPNNMVERTGPAPPAHHDRWADQSELATTMTTQAVIVGRGGGLLTWDGRL